MRKHRDGQQRGPEAASNGPGGSTDHQDVNTGHLLKPPALRPGDIVRLVSPSGPGDRDRIANAVTMLRDWGLEVQIGRHAFDAQGYLAGDDKSRVADLNDALADPQVRGVLCVRGGYGSSRIIDQVDYPAAAADPKPVVGYSDITALLQALYVHSGITSLHGPVMTTFASPRAPHVSAALRQALMTDADIKVPSRSSESTQALTRGDHAVSGRLLGGNVSLLADALGTASQPDYRGAILFCEEINEEPYRLDRMFTQLRRAGVFDVINGVALGQFTDCVDDDWDVTALDVLADRLAAVTVPIVGGLPTGHGDDPLTVPFGATATLDPASASLTAEAAVSEADRR